MPINKTEMKSINNRIVFTFFFYFFTCVTISAQEIIKDSVIVPIKKIQSTGKQKIDGVIATVGITSY
jgi:peptidyl-prolyl cis-trans isomerase SurA